MTSISVQLESARRRLRDNITEYISWQNFRAAKKINSDSKKNGHSKDSNYKQNKNKQKQKPYVSFTNKTLKSDTKLYHRKTIHKMSYKYNNSILITHMYYH